MYVKSYDSCGKSSYTSFTAPCLQCHKSPRFSVIAAWRSSELSWNHLVFRKWIQGYGQNHETHPYYKISSTLNENVRFHGTVRYTVCSNSWFLFFPPTVESSKSSPLPADTKGDELNTFHSNWNYWQNISSYAVYEASWNRLTGNKAKIEGRNSTAMDEASCDSTINSVRRLFWIPLLSSVFSVINTWLDGLPSQTLTSKVPNFTGFAFPVISQLVKVLFLDPMIEVPLKSNSSPPYQRSKSGTSTFLSELVNDAEILHCLSFLAVYTWIVCIFALPMAHPFRIEKLNQVESNFLLECRYTLAE